jgi:plastocyanin
MGQTARILCGSLDSNTLRLITITVMLTRTLLVTVVLLWGVWPSSATPPQGLVLMDSGSPYYVPAAVTVVSGASVRWDNPTPTHHTVTHDGCFDEDGRCSFDSGAVDPGGSYTIPNLPPGRYPYQCRIHPIMRGMIIVTDAAALPSQT